MIEASLCKSIGCCNAIESQSTSDFCTSCLNNDGSEQHLAVRYPNNFKPIGDLSEIDVFAINQMFKVQDPSGCLQHAIRKLLMANDTSTTYADIREARDTLTRWLQLNQPQGI